MRRGAAALLAATALLAGCGQRSAELFELYRTGSIPQARLTLLVFDDGTVRCNGGPPRRMPDEQLLLARELARSLAPAATRGLALPPGPGSILSYRLRLAEGELSFSDTSRGLSGELARVQGFARSVARQVCGLAR